MSNIELITADIVLDINDVETTYKVEKLTNEYLVRNKVVSAPSWSKNGDTTEQYGNYDLPDWVDFTWYEICGDNYADEQDFIRRIAYYQDTDGLSEITNGELSGYYLAHRNLVSRGADGFGYDDLLVVYTKNLDTWDENDNEIWSIQATIIEREYKSVGYWK
jgi:hypothetical protein